MAIIDIKNLKYSHIGSFSPIFEDVNLQLDTNWKLGLIGRNGYGKTTFLKLLLGEYPHKGEIHSSIEFEYFPYEIKDRNLLTIEIIEDLKGEFPIWKLEKELNLLNVDEEVVFRPFSTLSQGEQTKVLIATMFILEDKFLLIDEPTNHLDTHGRTLVAEYLVSKNGFIVVSHDREFLNKTVDHTLSIEKNKIVLQKGNYDTWKVNKKLEDEFELVENQKLRKEIRRLKKSAREKTLWSDKREKTKFGQRGVDRGFIGARAARMMKRSKTLEKRYEDAIEEKEKLLKNIEKIEELQIETLEHYDDVLVWTDEMSVHYDGNEIFQPLSFKVNQGECLVLSGGNGSGKSSILKAILGKGVEYNGNLHIASNIKISYVPQDFDFLKGDLFKFINFYNLDETQFLTILRKMGFSREQFEKSLESYSSGQKKKVLLTKSLCEKAHIYIWDEPLNFIDIISRIQLENMILKYNPTMIIVEHDKVFNESVATDMVEIIE